MSAPAIITLFGFVSGDAKIALTEFAFDFIEGYKAEPTPWAERLGLARSSQFLRTRWPIPVDAAEFRPFLGEINYRKLSHKTVEVVPGVWSDGVEELARVVEAPEFLGWMNAPAEQAEDAGHLPNRLITQLLTNGKTLPSFENPQDDNGNFLSTAIKFFDTQHPNNPFQVGVGGATNPIAGAAAGTFPNLLTGLPLTFDNVRKVRAHYRKWPAVSGVKKRGLRLTDILVHADQEQAVLELKREKYIMRPSLDQTGTTVGYMFAPNENANEDDYAFNVWIGEDLVESGVWYPLARNKKGTVPWAIQRRLIPGGVGMPKGWEGDTTQPPPGGLFEVIVNDKSSQRYRDTGYVSIAHKLELGAVLAHPWAILRCEPTGAPSI